jgi:hypothetical protein
MHRIIVGPDSPAVDHRNGNGRDDRRENLRSVTKQQTMLHMRVRVRNITSQYRGMYWSWGKQGWVAQIKMHDAQPNATVHTYAKSAPRSRVRAMVEPGRRGFR